MGGAARRAQDGRGSTQSMGWEGQHAEHEMGGAARRARDGRGSTQSTGWEGQHAEHEMGGAAHRAWDGRGSTHSMGWEGQHAEYGVGEAVHTARDGRGSTQSMGWEGQHAGHGMGGAARRAWDGRGSTQGMGWEGQHTENLTSFHLPQTPFPHSLLCGGVKALDHLKQKIHLSGTLDLHTCLPLPLPLPSLRKLNQTAQTALHHTQISGVEELVQHLGRGGEGRGGEGRVSQRNDTIRKWQLILSQRLSFVSTYVTSEQWPVTLATG